MTLIEVRARTEAPSWSIVWAAASLGLGGAIVFAAFPQIDLGFGGLFYQGDKTFLFGRDTVAGSLRDIIRWAFIFAVIGAGFGFFAVAFASRRLFGLGFAAWIYILLTVGIGAGLVANALFKDQWGRARPHQVTQFGGVKQFTAPLTKTDECERNCSFVSGEAASIFAIGFAIALLAEASRRRRLLIAAIAAGAFAGLFRVGGGSHFISDVFFAGVFMAIVARCVYWLLFERFEFWFADEGPLHRRTLYAGRRGGEETARMMRRARASRLAERARQLRLRERVQEFRRGVRPPKGP